MAKADWTPERVETLRWLWNAGKTASQIAKLIGGDFTRSAIIGKANRLGLPARTSPIWRNAGTARKYNRNAPPRNVIEDKTLKPSLRLSILDLDRNQCRFATHDALDGNHGFCGHKTAEGSSYCPAHKAVTIDAKRTADMRRKKKRRDDPDLTALRTAQRNAGLMRVFG